MMAFIFLILFSSLVFAEPCSPHEIYVREQWIKAYIKSDGTKVSAHSRNAYCRDLTHFNYFQDSTKQTFKGIKTTIKKWTVAPTEKSMDIFEKIFHLRTTQNIKDLNSFFGTPKEIKDAYNEPLVAEQIFDTKEGLPLHAFVNKQSQKVVGFVLTYWVDFDAYAYLKKRFKYYKWIETELPARTHLDYSEEIHKVEIPELGINFEYDNQDPLRRPMWIFFK